MPGSLASSWMTRRIGSDVDIGLDQTGHHHARDFRKLRLPELLGLLDTFVRSRQDEILEHSLVVGVDHFLLDLDVDDFLGAVDLDLDHAAARGRLDDALLELQVELLELLLHVLEGFAVLAHSAGWEHRLSFRFDYSMPTTLEPPNASRIFFTPGSAAVSAGRFGGAEGPDAPPDSREMRRATLRPNTACRAASMTALFLGFSSCLTWKSLN